MCTPCSGDRKLFLLHFLTGEIQMLKQWMTHMLRHHCVTATALLVVALSLSTSLAADSGNDLESFETLPSSTKVYKPLPARECWYCRGPISCPPCVCCQRSFLYYGRSPLRDDPVSGLYDCPNGSCGCHAVNLSLHWITLRESCQLQFSKSHATK